MSEREGQRERKRDRDNSHTIDLTPTLYPIDNMGLKVINKDYLMIALYICGRMFVFETSVNTYRKMQRKYISEQTVNK